MKTIYPEGKELRYKKTGARVTIRKAAYLKDNPDSFLNYEAEIEGKEGIRAVYSDDLEEIGETFYVIIAGGRDFKDYNLLKETCAKALANKSKIEIVSGTAEGADKLGEQYALLRGFQIKRFPADWKVYGKAAGYKRNEEMALYADALIAFWDGKSRGTAHMINLAKEHGLKVKVVKY